MESYPDNFETGSWTVREVVSRPRTRFFGLLSCLWLFVSVGASFPFWHGWPESFSGMEWFCTLIIGLEVLWVVVTISLPVHRASSHHQTAAPYSGVCHWQTPLT